MKLMNEKKNCLENMCLITNVISYITKQPWNDNNGKCIVFWTKGDFWKVVIDVFCEYAKNQIRPNR